MLNPTCEEEPDNSDNADAYDMTPNDTLNDGSNSPYQAIWDNDDLEDWLEIFYLGAPGSLDEQPGSTGSGNNGTRGMKLYMDTDPSLPGLCSRRIYQKVEGLTIGMDYTFSVESRSEATGTPSEVYMLNTEITDEVGINANGGADASVDGFLSITNDFDAFTSNSLTFTATNTFVVVYIRSLNSVDDLTEVFYDNFSLVEATLSTDEFSNSSFRIYPNPASDIIFIETPNDNLSEVNVYDILGKNVLSQSKLNGNSLDISTLTNGVYFVKVNAEGNSITKKIIIQ